MCINIYGFNDNGSFMSYDEFLHNYNFPNVYMMQFNSIISAIFKFLKSVSVEKACIKNLLSFRTYVF